MDDFDYIGSADTAKYLRNTLKKAYPGVQFYVRTKTYSGGASIDVTWMDGPSVPEIERIKAGFEGSDFDGMIDLKYGVKSWLLPDGTATPAFSPGSGGFHKGYTRFKPHEQARLVKFGVDFIFVNRHYSREFLERILEQEPEPADGLPRPKIVKTAAWISHTKSLESWRFEAGDTMTYIQEEDAIRRYMKVAREMSIYDQPEDKPSSNVRSFGNGFSVEHERDWTWVTFGAKPPRDVIDALKGIGARWSNRRTAWYIRERVEPGYIAELLAI